MYEIEFTTSAAKEFRGLENSIKFRVTQAIDALAENPRPGGVRKLRGHGSLYRARVGSFRVVYEINDQDRLVLVTRIRHRRDVYR